MTEVSFKIHNDHILSYFIINYIIINLAISNDRDQFWIKYFKKTSEQDPCPGTSSQLFELSMKSSTNKTGKRTQKDYNLGFILAVIPRLEKEG